MVTIADVMSACRNHFVRDYIDGTFTISAAGKITPIPSDGISGYVAIQGSRSNDGVYKCTGGTLEDERALDFDAETFTGRVWLLAPPKAFIALCGEIAEYGKKTPTGAMQSESFGENSYTRANGKRGVLTWQEAFADTLRPYVRLLSEVRL